MAGHKRIHGAVGGGLSDGIRHVQSVEIAGGQEAVHGAQADVIGVHVVGLRPAQFGHRGVGRGAHAGGLRSDDVVLAVRLVPNGDDFRARAPRGQHAGPQLRNGLVRETVSHSEGKSVDGQHGSAPIIIRGGCPAGFPCTKLIV